QSSLQDLLAAEADLFGGQHEPRDVEEVVNYVAAMNHGLARLRDLPVSVRLIREIHARLLDGVRGTHLNAWRTTAKPELDRALRLLAGRSDVCSTASRPGARRSWSARAVLTRRKFATASDPNRARSRPVRNHPPIPGRQRSRWTFADHISTL